MRSKHTNTSKSEEKLAGKEGIQTRNRCRSQRCSDSESIGSNNEPCPKQRRKMSDRANWTRENEAQFIVFCHQEYTNGQLLTTCFSRPVLGQICDRLNALVAGHSVFTLDHLKTKWKNIKKAWKLLYGLRFTRGSGLGWDPERETIVGTEDQLEAIYAGVVGAMDMDGTLIPALVPTDQQNAYRSRKATISQNVLAICDMNMMFTYVYAGWEGSASDAHILSNAIATDQHFPWPPAGKYYLVDAGFTNYGRFLASYKQTRYHLNEFRSAGGQARTPNELFNHRHSRLRNVIERCFGVLKSRFPILRYDMPSYTINRQVKIVIACCVIHNFIRRSGMEDEIFEENSEYNMNDEHLVSHATRQNIEERSDFRDAITTAMWQNMGV